MSILDSYTSKWYETKKLLKKFKAKYIVTFVVPIVMVFLIWKQTYNSNESSPHLLINNIMYDHFLTNDSITFKLKVMNHGSTAFNVLASDIKVYQNEPRLIDNNFLFDSLRFQIVLEKDVSQYFYVKSNAVCTGNEYRYEDKFLVGKILYSDKSGKNFYKIFAGLFKDDRFIPMGKLNKVGIDKE